MRDTVDHATDIRIRSSGWLCAFMAVAFSLVVAAAFLALLLLRGLLVSVGGSWSAEGHEGAGGTSHAPQH
ncbi:hypothetical protein OHB35_28605 [Streptomyces phaeochromogenes]|uniref:Uncharacterized protein n=1 Tax=Streptomyces phaeochromogenes TaxID=1923 RepID=A0ABZ1HE65_STRPH|nr:hypothetical protein [Streptomyces phaeochromogenes]WSD16891.1 hypothetical protein OHB35_28605 [Streptomyces phaeochromogenes]